MAKKAKATGGGKRGPKVVAAEGAPPKKLETTGMTPAKKLNSLLSDARKAYKEQRSISGEIGAAIKEAKEHDHLHTKAFGYVKALDRLEPEKLEDFFAHFDYYCDASGLRKRAGSVIRMNLDDGKDVGEQAAPPRAANVKPFPMPGGMAAE